MSGSFERASEIIAKYRDDSKNKEIQNILCQILYDLAMEGERELQAFNEMYMDNQEGVINDSEVN